MRGNRAGLLDKIEQNIHYISNDRNKSEEVKDELSKYRILAGRVEEYFSDPVSTLEEADIRELALVTEQVYVKTGKQDLNPENWFTTSEMKEARQYDYLFLHGEDAIQFPIEIENVIHLGNDLYAANLSIKTIARLLRSKKLNYNYEIQRQETKVKRMDKIIFKPTVYKKNVTEIKELLLKGELKVTTLAFNAATGTSDDGEELTYNAKKNTLTINDGTRLDILDGYHRCLASEQAYSQNPDLDFGFLVLISNYTTRQAQQYQAQLAKATPIPPARIQELEKNSLSATVVDMLKSESYLKGRISSSSSKVNLHMGELVNYRILAEAIDREFPMKLKKEAREVGSYLAAFFEELIENNPDEFLDIESYDESLMAYNKMFAGYIALAAEMKEQKIRLDELDEILSKVDFNRNNKLWNKLNIIDEEGRINNNIKETDIAEYFKTLV